MSFRQQGLLWLAVARQVTVMANVTRFSESKAWSGSTPTIFTRELLENVSVVHANNLES